MHYECDDDGDSDGGGSGYDVIDLIV